MALRSFATLVSIAPVILLSTSAASADSRSVADELADRAALANIVQHPYRDLCDATPLLPGQMRCYAKARTDEVTGDIIKFAAPQAYGPADLRSAYKLPTSGGNGQIVAIVDANDYPNAEQDLATYRQQYGLAPCTTSNGCFKKVDQNGGSSYPQQDTCQGWGGEIMLDLDMVSAACPDCHILLVEANSASSQNLAQGVQTAIQLGAVAVSNSYGGPEDSTVPQFDPSYKHAGVWITASAGDQGYGASFPATGSGVLAVGGTSLQQSGSSRGWAEAAWNSGGSGCSAYISKPSWQNDQGCTNRMESDVSAVGDPNTGVSVYCGGWQVVGGTSASSPLVAASFTAMHIAADPSLPWKHPQAFFDVTSGSNGQCSTSYYCNAGTGYDGPTGWGTPNGQALTMLSGGSSGGSGSSSGSSSGGSSGSSSGGSSGSSSGSGSSSSSGGSSSSGFGASSGSGSGGAGVDAGSNANNDTNNIQWNPDQPPAGCGCSVVDGGESYGGLALGLGLVLGFGVRRRRSRRQPPAE